VKARRQREFSPVALSLSGRLAWLSDAMGKWMEWNRLLRYVGGGIVALGGRWDWKRGWVGDGRLEELVTVYLVHVC